MIKKFNIKHDKKEYSAIINLNTIRNFSREKGLKKVSDFAEVLSVGEGEEVTFDVLENFALLLRHAIIEGARQAGTTVRISTDDIFTMFDNQAELMTSIRGALNDEPADDETPEEETQTSEVKKKTKSPGKNSNKSVSVR
jgi:hypothetical protein